MTTSEKVTCGGTGMFDRMDVSLLQPGMTFRCPATTEPSDRGSPLCVSVHDERVCDAYLEGWKIDRMFVRHEQIGNKNFSLDDSLHT